MMCLPRERPADLEPGQDARERAGDQDPHDVAEARETVVLARLEKEFR